MSELCHICDLFRTALFGPTNTEEDHLGDQGNDLPRPMADAPATMRSRTRGGASSAAVLTKSREARGAHDDVNGMRVATSGPTAPSTAGAPPGPDEGPTADAAAGTSNGMKPAPKTKFNKRGQRGLKAAPVYMSFDDVDVEDDDSDGELFVDEANGSRNRNSAANGRSPHHGEHGTASISSYTATPSVYRAPVLENEGIPHGGMPPPPEYSSNVYVNHGGRHMVGHAGDVDEAGAYANGHGRGMGLTLDGGSVEGARPHAQSITESFHGYKGYPGYEPETPVAADLAPQPGRCGSTESLTIRAAHEVPDRRDQADPTPSSMRRNARVGQHAGLHGRHGKKRAGSIDSDLAEHHNRQSLSISPSGTMDHMTSVGGDSQLPSSNHHMGPGTGLSYGSRSGSVNYRPSPANSIASSFRRDDGRSIPAMPSEDGMGSVLGTIGGAEDAANEDLQWKRSALKKFHKVMVKGEGLRVVKHNRAGGSQTRIIRYDPEIKALVWNSKRYMKKAGSANVPIVGIKRVGREGNTVSVTAAGRGTIGFEPARIRDAKILAEALRALVDKEERSAMWRG